MNFKLYVIKLLPVNVNLGAKYSTFNHDNNSLMINVCVRVLLRYLVVCSISITKFKHKAAMITEGSTRIDVPSPEAP